MGASLMIYRLVLATSLIYCLIGSGAQADPTVPPLPFGTGEELVFKVSWLGITVGTATMKIEAHTTDTGVNQWRLISRARSHPFFDTFYKVDDHIESLFDPHTRLPSYFFTRQHEGKRQRQYEMRFDQPQRHVTYLKRNKPPVVFETKTEVQDPLSILYAVRALPLEVGKTVIIPLFNKGNTWLTEVKVLKREQLKLSIGHINTIKVQPRLRESGIFHHKGKIFVWLTDDQQRIPVQLKSTIKIGSVKARLIQAKGVQLSNAECGIQDVECGINIVKRSQ